MDIRTLRGAPVKASPFAEVEREDPATRFTRLLHGGSVYAAMRSLQQADELYALHIDIMNPKNHYIRNGVYMPIITSQVREWMDNGDAKHVADAIRIFNLTPNEVERYIDLSEVANFIKSYLGMSGIDSEAYMLATVIVSSLNLRDLASASIDLSVIMAGVEKLESQGFKYDAAKLQYWFGIIKTKPDERKFASEMRKDGPDTMDGGLNISPFQPRGDTETSLDSAA